MSSLRSFAARGPADTFAPWFMAAVLAGGVFVLADDGCAASAQVSAASVHSAAAHPEVWMEGQAGDTYGRWTVLSEAPRNNGRRVLCRCACGREKIQRVSALVNGATSSCSSCANTRHGIAKSMPAEYGAWHRMIRRCYTEGTKDYPNYGGRGITVCDRWRESVAAFVADMGPMTGPEYQLDRINNDGNYEPGNCRWATASQNNQNQRRNRRITAFGETLCVTEWARRTGIDRWTIAARLDRGLAPEIALLDNGHDGRREHA